MKVMDCIGYKNGDLVLLWEYGRDEADKRNGEGQFIFYEGSLALINQFIIGNFS